MALDAYSLCPGGTGKKIKFCCNDFLPELQKIDRMVEGEQYLACLKHIDLLLEQEPNHDRACLLATKCLLLRITDQHDAARTTAEAFLAKHPDNPVALAELAMLSVDRDARQALDYVRRSLCAGDGQVSGRTYQAMGLTAGALLHAGLPLPARTLLQLQLELAEGDGRPAQLLSALNQATDVPLLLREDQPIAECPENAVWKDRFTEAMQAVALADWQAGADRLTALAADEPNEPAVWRNLAMLRGWLADNPGAIEALRKYAALRAQQPEGLEDAVEAEAEALFLSEDTLSDRADMLSVTWTINDVDRAQEAFLSSPRFRVVQFDPSQFSNGETPPPKAAYMLLDRPMPASAEGLTLETMPCMLGQALLFGRQTDREARLDVMGIAEDDLPAITSMINETAGDAVAPDPKRDVMGRWSATQKLLRTAWQPPRDASPDVLRSLLVVYQHDAICRRWPELKLGIFDGRSAREVAGDPAWRIRLLAAIMVLDHLCERLPNRFDMNELRTELGLPTLGPIDAKQYPLDTLPTIRLYRLTVEGLSDEDLVMAYYRSAAFAIRPAVRKFAAEIIHRPSMANSDERLHAFATLARSEEDLSRALDYVDQGRKAAAAKKESCASWDLMELSLHFASQNGQEAMRVAQHLQEKHLEEPGVSESLARMLMEVGLIHPDGTPAYPAAGPESAMMPTEAPAAEPGGLWTPDSATPGAGSGKLWTPD